MPSFPALTGADWESMNVRAKEIFDDLEKLADAALLDDDEEACREAGEHIQALAPVLESDRHGGRDGARGAAPVRACGETKRRRKGCSEGTFERGVPWNFPRCGSNGGWQRLSARARRHARMAQAAR